MYAVIHAFDAGPLLAFLDAETGGAVTLKILVDNPGECFAHTVNYPLVPLGYAPIIFIR